jgi:hypothetical protein
MNASSGMKKKLVNCASCHYSIGSEIMQLMCMNQKANTIICLKSDHDCPHYLYEPGTEREERK